MNTQANPSTPLPSSKTPQHVPLELTQLMLLLVMTHFSTMIINQPPAYWLDPQYASQKMIFGFLLRGGPWLFLKIALPYLIILWLLLRTLPALQGLLLAAFLSLPHALGLFETIRCGWKPIYEAHSSAACYTYSLGFLITFFVLFTLILLGSRLPNWLQSLSKRLMIPLAAGLVMILGYGVFRVALPHFSAWQPLAPKHSPGPRASAAIAYDTKRHRAVLFGGISEWNGKAWVYNNSTWEWDGKDWIKIDTPVSPTGRILHAMAYDEKRGTVVMYGGQNASEDLADLWEYDGITWRRLCPVCNPAARFGHKMFFDPELQKIVIYGGQAGGTGYSEAWTWDGEAWSFLPFDTSAPGIFNAPLIHLSEEARTISFIPGDYGGTWVWENNSWSKLDITVQPPLRNESVLVYDPVQNQSILFGGTLNFSLFFNDTWILDEETWTQLEISRPPQQRYRAVAFYDPTRESIIMYGGDAPGQLYGDMWEFTFPGETNP